MSTPREELHALIDELPDDAAAELVPDMRAILRHRLRMRRRDSAEQRPWPPSWFGAAAGSAPDIAARNEEILRDELGRRS
ncbi:hypothetical protein FB561_0093 [Kribbella amoyensis]|uniref:Uncharacterized protein n=1 Tax=Kribbella amoyensis TaxID=996641 RepID=A0A561BJK1_9ACTN|nr:hypothetical protein [Kribbella amoyensis]TWD79043.1 hypothetical protein FB561_0093 [Kribbella amoyensis]